MWTMRLGTVEAIHMFYRQHKQQRTRFAWFQLWRGRRNDTPSRSCSSKHNSVSSSKENVMDNLEGLNRKSSPQQNFNEHGDTGDMTRYSNKAAMLNTSSRTAFINCAYNPASLEITNSYFHNFFKILELFASSFSIGYCKLVLGSWKIFD